MKPLSNLLNEWLPLCNGGVERPGKPFSGRQSLNGAFLNLACSHRLYIQLIGMSLGLVV